MVLPKKNMCVLLTLIGIVSSNLVVVMTYMCVYMVFPLSNLFFVFILRDCPWNSLLISFQRSNQYIF